MKPKKAVKELEKQLRKDPENLVLRLRLAAALREVGRTEQAVTLYRSVAVQYHSEGRLAQAIAVCKSVLEIDPGQRETQSLLVELESMMQAHEPLPSIATHSRAPSQTESSELYAPQQGQPSQPQPPPVHALVEDEPDEVAPASDAPAAISPNLPSNARPTRPMPSVRVLDAPSNRPAQRTPALDEFDRRSGMTPAEGDLELPSLAAAPAAPRRKSDPVINGDSRPPGVRSRRRSQPMGSSSIPRDTIQHGPPRMTPGRSSRPLLTPTPLPPPVASHDLEEEESIATNPKLAPIDAPPPLRTPTGEIPQLRRRPPPMPDDVDDEALTTVAPESGWRPPELDDSLVPPQPQPPPPRPKPAPRPRVPARPKPAQPLARLKPVAGPARPQRRPPTAPPAPAPAPEPEQAPASGGVFDEATRFGDSLAEAGAAALRPPSQPEPPRRARRTTRNTLRVKDESAPVEPATERNTLRIGEKPQAAEIDEGRNTNPMLGRSTSETDQDEITGVRRVARGKPPQSYDDEDDGPTRLDPQLIKSMDDFEIVDDEDDGIGLERAFDRTFADTLRGLAPDGSAIDSPLTIFSELPEEALNELVRRMSLRSFRPGEIVLREGDPGDACFVIATGSVRVLKRDPANERSEMIEVARLGSGAVFGEFALLADRRRHATVQAVEPTDLYEIPRRLLRELAATFDDVGPALERFYRERLLSTLLATAPFFAPLEQDARSDLLARFKPNRFESGQRIIDEGSKAGGLYLIVLGSVEITKRVSDRRSVLLTTLGEGAYFGELSLMRGGTARASVTALGPTELAMLPPQAFYEIVAANPVLWEGLRKEAHRRELMLRQIVTGETGVV